MTRGGARKNAGRVAGTGHYGESTVVMRVPASKVSRVRDFLENADNPEQTCPLISFPPAVQALVDLRADKEAQREELLGIPAEALGMTHYDQTTFDDKGDCLRACIRTLLQDPMPDFPNPADMGSAGVTEWWQETNKALHPYGVCLMGARIDGKGEGGGRDNPVVKKMPRLVAAVGPSWRGSWDHAVVWDTVNWHMVHDPAPARNGLPWLSWIYWLEPL